MNLVLDDFVALAPILITSATALFVMLAIALRRHHWWNATITVVGLNLALLSVLVASLLIPRMVTPLLIIDGHACFYMGLVLVATLACATLAHAYLEGFLANKEEFYLLLVLAAVGGLVLVCSRHFASMFIGIELLTVPAYGMVGYTYAQSRSLEGAVKYLILSATGTAFMLFGMALLYAYSGSLAFEDLGKAVAGVEGAVHILYVGIGMVLVGIAFKLSLVPFHLWTPDVYEAAPAPSGAFLATASKIAVFAVLVRFLVLTPVAHAMAIRDILSVIAFASIIVGNLLALTQTNLKRLLGYSSIAHFGYLLVALIAGGGGSLVAIAVYMLTYVLTTLAAFGVITLMSSPYRGRDADALFDYRGLFWQRPVLSSVLTVTMLSLAGIPLTAGFIGKFYVVTAAVMGELWWLLGAVVVGSALGVYYYLRVLAILFLATPNMRRHDVSLHWAQRMGGVMVLGITGIMFVLGVYPQPLITFLKNIQIMFIN